MLDGELGSTAEAPMSATVNFNVTSTGEVVTHTQALAYMFRGKALAEMNLDEYVACIVIVAGKLPRRSRRDRSNGTFAFEHLGNGRLCPFKEVLHNKIVSKVFLPNPSGRFRPPPPGTEPKLGTQAHRVWTVANTKFVRYFSTLLIPWSVETGCVPGFDDRDEFIKQVGALCGWAPNPEGDAEEVDSRVESAVTRRKSLLERGASRHLVQGETYTDALRLIHGEADGLPGITVDLLGPLLRLGIFGSAAAGLLGSVVRSLDTRLPELGLEGFRPWVEVRYEVTRLKPDQAAIRWRELPPSAWLKEHVDAAGRVWVRERGLSLGVDPGFSEPRRPRPGVGLFLDQRENRARLSRRAEREGGEWLNLFAHTGAFSVALLAAGAERVVSVDLSASYLAWLQENLERNFNQGEDLARHESIRKEGRRYMASLPSGHCFAGIVLDPPTAASAGRHYWSIKRDLEPLVGDCLERLQSGGVLLVSRNDRFAPSALRQLVERIAGRRRVPLARLDVTGPGPDFPRVKGFQEGDPFCGIVAQRA
ncbi:MAG: hypothetical protein CMN75_17100 [Spirochaeta sp.]|nr:hypothetical protein [Spirochaeta sp.]